MVPGKGSRSIFSACEIERRAGGAIASCARSYVCFGPIIPVGFARERLGACLNIAPYKQGGRARLSQALLARNKRRYSVGGQAFLRCSELKSLAVSNGSSPLMHAQMPVRYLRMTAAIACIFFLPLLISDS